MLRRCVPYKKTTSMRKFVILIFITLVFENCVTQNGYLKFDSVVPGIEPKVLAKDIFGKSNMYIGYCTFDKTGTDFYFAVTDKDWGTSRICRISTTNPSKVDTLFFVDKMWEGEPFINFNGDKMFFTAILPPKENQPWHSDFYCVNKTDSGWSKPNLLKVPLNSPASEWHISSTKNGILYFGSERGTDRLKADLYRAIPENGQYKNIEKLPYPINTEFNDCDPLIAPDESFLIFHSDRPGGYGAHDLYVCFRNKKNEWTSPKNMGPSINTQGWEMAPSLSPDGKYLFFTRRKDFQTLEPSKIFWVDIRIIDKFR